MTMQSESRLHELAVDESASALPAGQKEAPGGDQKREEEEGDGDGAREMGDVGGVGVGGARR